MRSPTTTRNTLGTYTRWADGSVWFEPHNGRVIYQSLPSKTRALLFMAKALVRRIAA